MSNAYPYVLAIGVSIAMLWLGTLQRRAKLAGSIDLGLIVLFAGLIGARIAHVIGYWNYYNSRLTEAAQFWQGGLSWAGAALGCLLGLALYDAVADRDFWADADSLAAPALVVGAAGWFGCLLDACAYGQPAPGGPMMPDLLGVEAPRWPTQAIGGVLTLIALGMVYRMTDLEPAPGVPAAAALAALGAINLALATVRGDPAPVVGGLRLDGLAAAGLTALGAAALLLKITSAAARMSLRRRTGS